MQKLTQTKLKELLDYDPLTGVFVWKTRPANCIHIGDIAGSVNNYGYGQIQIYGKNYSSQRLAWLYVHGTWPEFQIDHRNHNRVDNRIANLRDVTPVGNGQNRIKAQANNLSSGLLGASFNKRCGQFSAQINVSGKRVHIGYFDDAESAHAAYLVAKREHHSTCTI